MDFSKPIKVEPFENLDFCETNFNNYNFHKPSKLDLSKIRVNHLNEEEQCSILKLCQEFSDIFYKENEPLTFTNRIKHQIKTVDEQPVYSKSYRYPFVHRQEVEDQIKKMLDSNIIRPSNSPWSSPIWVVPKKVDASGKRKWRVVIDFRKLNEKSIDDKYPLPNINDLLDKLGKCQYFTTLDLASGFHQIEMDEKDVEKTAFNTENGHFEFLRMPFGLKNAPATFQRVMDNILRGIQNEKCLVYLDDIIVYSTSLQEHIERLRTVFQRLREANFKIQLDKSEFLRKEVAYLGHVVTPEGVKPNPEKIKAIRDYPLPKTTKQIKGFLGLLGYYRRFIRDFAKLTKPFTKCLKKNAKIVLNDEYLACFETCKNLLMNEPILQYPDFSQPFNLSTDASNVALGAVLSQGPIGKDLPIAYASRTLNQSEQNYSVIEKELLAIVWATKYFRPYLYGQKFNIITDHKPLQWLFSLKDPSSKLLRWRIKLEEFDYQIIYKKGKLNTNADALSRVEIHTKETKSNESTESFWAQLDDIIKQSSSYKNTPPTFDYEKLQKPPIDTVQQSLLDIDNMSTFVNVDDEHFDQFDNEIPTTSKEIIEDQIEDDATIHTNAEHHPTVQIPITDIPVNYGQNQIIINSVFHSPAKPKITNLFDNKQRINVQFSENNFDNDVVNFIKEYIAPKVQYHLYFESPQIYERFCVTLQNYFKWPSIKFKKCNKKLIDVVDKNDVKEIIENYHMGKTNHRGIEETLNRIKEKYYWIKMKESIQTYINDCEICQQSKYERNPIKTKLNLTPTALKPFEIVHLDTFTFEQSKFLTIIDSFSKYAQAYPLCTTSGTEIADNLINFFSHHGIPNQIIVDNGTEFKNSVITELLSLHKIKIHFCSPNHPQSNGIIERFHSTLKEHIRLLNTQGFLKTPIKSKVIYSILAYNHTIHSVTKLKPIDIINGHITENEPFNLDLDKILVNDYVEQHKQRSKVLYSKLNSDLLDHKTQVLQKVNAKRDPPNLFQPNDKVFIKKHTRQKHANKFEHSDIIQNVNEERKTISTTQKPKIHMDNLKRPLRKLYSFD